MTRSFRDMNLTEEALGGLSAGIVGTVIGFPLDLIKTRMQTSSKSSGPNSILGVALQIVRTEGGILALYRGILPPMVSLSILNTMGFTSYSFFRDVYGGTNGWDYRNGLAGMTGAPMFSVVSTVENLVKTQMQMDNITNKRFRNTLHFLRQLFGHNTVPRAVSIVYTGHGVNTVREGAFCGSYFFAYEGFREIMIQQTPLPVQTAVPVAGGLAGATAWTFSFPLDCVRARVQSVDVFRKDHLEGRNARRGALAVLRLLLQEKGVAGLYSGVGPSVARAFLVSGSRFSAYEGALWLLRGGRDARRSTEP